MKKTPQAPRFYGRFARFGKWLLRSFSHRYHWQVQVPSAPVVYVCRHLNMHGPYTTLKWCPFDIHPMVIHVFFDRRTATEHLRQYTFSARYGRKPSPFGLLSRLVGTVAPAMMRSLKGIPVHRDSAAIGTLKHGLKCLLQGESLIIYPDISYTDGYETPAQIYDGFLALGDLYFRKTGKPLCFVPLVIEDENRRIVARKPVYVSDHRTQPDAFSRIQTAIDRTGNRKKA